MISKNDIPDDDLAPWEQLPGDTDKAYDRFISYLKLGADRSLEKVRQKYGKKSGYDRHLEKVQQ